MNTKERFTSGFKTALVSTLCCAHLRPLPLLTFANRLPLRASVRSRLLPINPTFSLIRRQTATTTPPAISTHIPLGSTSISTPPISVGRPSISITNHGQSTSTGSASTDNRRSESANHPPASTPPNHPMLASSPTTISPAHPPYQLPPRRHDAGDSLARDGQPAGAELLGLSQLDEGHPVLLLHALVGGEAVRHSHGIAGHQRLHLVSGGNPRQNGGQRRDRANEGRRGSGGAEMVRMP